MSRTNLTRRDALHGGTAASAALLGLAGCLGTATGTLATQVTDQPGDIDDFESCVIEITGLWLGPLADDGETTAAQESDDRQFLEFDSPETADLVELTENRTALIDEREIETGEYAFLQLEVGDVQATLADGSSASVMVPGSAPLTFNRTFEIREDTRTVFTADFTPVKQGQTGRYVLQPVPSGITVDYED